MGWGQMGSQRREIGLFGVSMNPRTHFPSSALHGPHCLSCDFTWLACKIPALEKQTIQLSLLMWVVYVSWANKMTKCDILVGFPISSHI